MSENRTKAGKTFQPYEMVTIIEQMQAFSTSNKPIDYGTGELYHTREIHMLSYIADHPGISPSEAARHWNQTRGAISQMLRKLTDRGLIRTVPDENDRRSSALYVTPKGELLDHKHKEYDTMIIEKYLDLLRSLYSDEEIQLAYRVLNSWVDIFLKESLPALP